jgi:hypothetical protein
MRLSKLIQFMFRASKSFRSVAISESFSREVADCAADREGKFDGGGERRLLAPEMQEIQKRNREETGEGEGDRVRWMLLSSPRAPILTTPVSRRHL